MKPRLILSLLFVMLSLVSSADTICWNLSRGFETFSEQWPRTAESNSGIVENPGGRNLEIRRGVEGNEDLEFRFKVRNHNCNPSKRYGYTDESGQSRKVRLPQWDLTVGNGLGENYIFRISSGETESDGISTQPCLNVESILPDGKAKTFKFKERSLGEDLIEGIGGPDPTGSLNYFRLNYKDGELKLYGGLHSLVLLCSEEVPASFEIKEIGFNLSPGSKLEFGDMRLSTNPQKRQSESTPWEDEEMLSQYLQNSRDDMEGYWQVLDRSLEETMLKMGGDYRFAIVRALDGYDLIYLSGARVNADNWSHGMVKGHLSPSGIEGVWDVSWTDSMFGNIATEVKAQLESNATLGIQFPYHNSSLRLQKTR